MSITENISKLKDHMIHISDIDLEKALNLIIQILEDIEKKLDENHP
jgi:hypothetical protein